MSGTGGLGSSLPIIPEAWLTAQIDATDLPYDLSSGGAFAGALSISEILEDVDSGITWLDATLTPVVPAAGTLAPYFVIPATGIWGMEIQFDCDKQGGSGAQGTIDISAALYSDAQIALSEETKMFDTTTQSPCNNHLAVAPAWINVAAAFPAGLGQIGQVAYAAGLDDLEIQNGLKLRIVKYR